VVVGRGESADVQLLDMGLSRVHCSLAPDGDGYVIEDANSRNGTWVNGERVNKTRLRPGDRIRIGGIEFEFRQGDAAAPDDQEASRVGTGEVLRREFKERLTLDESDLMQLPPEAQSVETFRRIQRELSTIYKIGNLINAESNLESLYERVLDAIFEVISPDRAFLMLLPREGEELEIAAQRQHTSVKLHQRTAFSHTVTQECVSKGMSILRLDAMTDEQFGKAQSVIDQNIHSVLCVPVESADHILGVIYSDRVASSAVFAKHDLELVAAVGKQAGIAIERVRLLGQVRRMLYSTVRALVATIEAKDENTKGHSVRVTTYALQLAQSLDLADEELSTLELACLLHDVGKIGVDENILRKPGALDKEEIQVIRQHPVVGEEIVRNVESSDLLADIVRHHHERWDGQGYPDGLKKTETNLLARILQVADAFDAMTSWRPYRDRLTLPTVIEEIKKGAGAQFDPKLVTCLLGELEGGRIIPF
jgi:putative nucleotidyltransferase with HDIG domain